MMNSEVLFYQGKLVSFADAVQLHRDEFLYGNTYLRETDVIIGGEKLYERLDPLHVTVKP